MRWGHVVDVLVGMNCSIDGCDHSRFVGERIQPVTGKRYPYTFNYCSAHKRERDLAAQVLGLPANYEDYLHRIPQVTVTIEPEDEKAWLEHHRKKHKRTGAIGGGITFLNTPTSIGTIRHIACSSCREEVYISEDF